MKNMLLKTFFEKLLKRTLNIWSFPDISQYSIYRRLTKVKILATSKVTFICSMFDTPYGFTDEVNNLIFGYIWKNKNLRDKKQPDQK